MIGKTETLRYRMQPTISSPVGARLAGNNIVWHSAAEVWDEGLSRGCIVPKMSQSLQGRLPVEGCLKEFVRLADASPEDVLRFVKERGVLGIVPKVAYSHSFTPAVAGGTKSGWWYAEPVSVYTVLARIATEILDGIGRVKRGEAVPGDAHLAKIAEIGMLSPRASVSDETARRRRAPHHSCRQPTGGRLIKAGVTELAFTAAAYLNWTWSAQEWAEAATYRLSLLNDDLLWFEDEAALAAVEGMSGPEMWLTFGQWRASYWWDARRSKQKARWRPEYIPHPEQRPSPLFNVLAFQLQQEVALPEDTFFCGYCQKPYQHTYEMGNRPRAGRKSFCGDACKLEHQRAYDRTRKQKAAPSRTVPAKAD